MGECVGEPKEGGGRRRRRRKKRDNRMGQLLT
jgi:hypothetical protein